MIPSRPPDFTRGAETFGWDSPLVRRTIGGFLGTPVEGEITKAVADSTSAGSMIHQGFEPTVYEAFIRRFPLYDAIAKEEANGLVHAYTSQTAYSSFGQDTPVTMTESGSVIDDANTYSQSTTNIAIFGTRRGSSLKSLFALRQGVNAAFGDLSEREAQGGMTKIAHDVQAEMLRFNNTNAAATTSINQDGLYDANGFNGLRYKLQNTSPAANTIGPIDITTGYTPSSQAIAKAIGQASDAIVEAGGMPDMIIAGTLGKRALINEQFSLRSNVANTTEFRPGVFLTQIETGHGALTIFDVPGDTIGTYTKTTGPVTNVQDIYVLDSSSISIPWLGGPTPTVLDIPIGADGTLRKLKIPFLMVGLACHVPAWLARVQVKTS